MAVQPYKAIGAIAGTAVVAGGAAVAGRAIWREAHREPGDPHAISKGKFAAYMGASIAAVGGFVAADKLGALDRLERVAGTAGGNPVARAGAAALMGVAVGGMVLSLPGALAGTGWGWVALAAPED
jgi:hypothetical protein